MPVPFSSRKTAPLALILLGASLAASACGGSSSNASNRTAATTSASVTSASTAALSTHSTGAPAKRSGGSTSNGQGTSTASSGGSQSTPSNPAPAAHNKPANTPTHFSPQLVAALKTFATCIRSQGVNLPEPNLSGHGQVFNDKGINTNSPQFHTALSACEGDLLSVLRAGGAQLPGASGKG
ncbi:MAG: hypothetical protein KGJ43_06215 [Acidobacteriota bacterium]|nr:hypothetical protein [Acidobacteriota bacterium]